MRADRAYIAGLGTTTVLVASALLLLAVVSTLVAFRGWPGAGLAEDIDHLVVEQPKPKLSVQGPSRAALDAAAAARAVAAAPAPGSAAAAAARRAAAQADSRITSGLNSPGSRGVVPRTRVRVNTGQPTPTTNPVSALPPPVRSPLTLLPETPVSGQVNGLTNGVTTGLADTTQDLTGGLGQTVGLVSPQLGQTLTDTGQALSDLLRSLGATP